ncbi:TetR/AcrR family transcriptional regulator [Saccharopolyspora endophytica]|uniref:TetR/AcrR family transcriptional regulator n=1 Tax=Saccharopolyspora endophytica TaxID=543886 RepID=A0ABS5DI14_9PSEU|nr:TetR/AcrR family transcriptional regulator [Saccharopolyspora endophytica]MBQ0925932.1 TetR/AcrR family transcriptional regulator [Saccharopolyspora endophytica]
MKRPAWNGAPPRDGEEAKARIIDAAMRCIDRHGPGKTSLSDVAAELGVIRQTVYRYFPSTEELFIAVGFAALNSFLERLVAHLAGRRDPADVVVEAMAYAIEQVPKDPYLGLFLDLGRPEAFSRGATSARAFDACRIAFARTDVDWDELGFSGDELTELLEFLLRVLLSFANDPLPGRDGADLRSFLRRWVTPAILAPTPAP